MSSVIARVTEVSSRHGASELERVDYLDGWRGLAIAFVLQEHFLLLYGFESGRLGVDIFFCLSGFLMSRILFVKRTPLATFYKRRISRIFPVFLLFVAVVYGSASLAGGPVTWGGFAATVTFLRTYLPSTPDIWNTGLPIGHLWSLNVEEHSYVLLSALTIVAAVRTRAGWVLVSLAVLAIGVHLVYVRHPEIAPPTFDIRTETAAAFPLMSAGYFLLRDRWKHLVRPWMPVAAFLIAVLSYWKGMPWWVSELLTPFLLAFAVNHLDQTGEWVRRLLAITPLRLLGICSYSIYLWQQPFYEFKAHFPPGLALAGALVTGSVSFYLFENPVRTWLNRHW